MKYRVRIQRDGEPEAEEQEIEAKEVVDEHGTYFLIDNLEVPPGDYTISFEPAFKGKIQFVGTTETFIDGIWKDRWQ